MRVHNKVILLSIAKQALHREVYRLTTINIFRLVIKEEGFYSAGFQPRGLFETSCLHLFSSDKDGESQVMILSFQVLLSCSYIYHGLELLWPAIL
ncbi:hypothetical protein RRG08_054863 [Elysia crispata]|uniref:Uncharacterized protein n=1 Tax=Elysia crispata TaxID=231223 RepID=A0AAE1A561_9GAST|nr:hypothetical protein RRG08_054863 [Elysia crispata]